MQSSGWDGCPGRSTGGAGRGRELYGPCYKQYSMMRTGIYSLVELFFSLIVLFGKAEALYASVSPRNGVLTADSKNDLAS